MPPFRVVSLGASGRRGVRRGLPGLGLLVAALTAAACSTPAEMAPQPEPVALRIGGENVVPVERGTIVLGPLISGELRPRREATIRAEIGGSLTEVAVDEGETVAQGDLIARIETRTLEDARASAQSSVESLERQLAIARREADRTEQLVEAGALAVRDLDLAQANVAALDAQLADARARLASAERQLGDTVLRAPISGVVASRAANAGDVISVGAEIVTIIDPSSMRLEAAVPSEDLSYLRVGAPVHFSVRGYDQPFEGRIERIAPQADPATRQVPIFVSIPNVNGRLVAGLFAEGRVVSESATGLVVPASAINARGSEPWVARVRHGTVERVEVSLGLQDPQSERVLVTAGLEEGDLLLRGAAQGITPGTPVELHTR